MAELRRFPNRVPLKRAGVALTLLTLALLAALPASAHQSLYLGTGGQDRASALILPDADIAWAVFGTLPPGAAQFLSFERPASGWYRARVLVPARGANPLLNPWIALVGPGLERPDGLDWLLADGEGAILVAAPESRELEIFQDLPYPVVSGASLELELPAHGPYHLIVFDPSGETGAYLIDTGYLQD